jgi:hypothetical protein
MSTAPDLNLLRVETLNENVGPRVEEPLSKQAKKLVAPDITHLPGVRDENGWTTRCGRFIESDRVLEWHNHDDFHCAEHAERDMLCLSCHEVGIFSMTGARTWRRPWNPVVKCPDCS